MPKEPFRSVQNGVSPISETLGAVGSGSSDVRSLQARTDLSSKERLEAIIEDQRARWLSGERIPAEAYLQWFPALLQDDELTLDLVYHEYLLREEAGDRPTLNEYVVRFPKHAESLRLQVELHRAIEANAPGEARLANDTPQMRAKRDTVSQDSLLGSPWPDIPGYSILEEIGRGGMGVIYKARQQSGHRLVALKMISTGEFAGPAELARFRTESEAIVHLQHPHIVTVYEVGTHRELPWLALEYMDRGSLSECILGNPLQPHHAAKLVELLARTIQTAHERGIIHRDLKPANVLLATPTEPSDKDAVSAEIAALLGIPKISDFGLAKRLDGDGGQTTSGAILGTPNYMAPEQAEGNTKHVGPAADIYSLGAVLYEALTGRPPHKGPTLLETLERVRTQEPIAPDRVRSNLPSQLVAICLKALSKEPHRRYASAGAMADDLRLFLDDGRVKARREKMIERGWRWCRRNPRLAGLSAGVAVMLLITAGVLGVAVLVREERDKAIDADRRTQAAMRELKTAQAEIKIQSHLARAGSYRRSGQVGQRFKALAELKAALALAPNPELRAEMRNEALAALVLPDLEVEREWQLSSDAKSGELTLSPDLKRFARLLLSGELEIGRITDTGTEQVLFRLPKCAEPPHSGPYWSPDGRFLLISQRFPGGSARGKAIRIWRVDGPEPTRCLAREDEQTGIHESAFSFRPDGNRLAIGQSDGTLRVFDLETGTRIRTLNLESPAFHLCYHPTDNRLAAALGNEIRILDTEGERPPTTLSQPAAICSLAWHPDGKRLAVACNNLKIHIWDTARPEEIMALGGHRELGIHQQFNAIGDRILSSDHSGQVRLWDTASGRLLLTATGFACSEGPNDGLVGWRTQGGKGHLLRMAQGRELRLLSRRGADNDEKIYSPTGLVDSRVLAAASLSPGGKDWLNFFDMERGEELTSLPQLGWRGYFVLSHHGDGGWLTWMRHGTLLWPSRPDPDQPGVLRIGPPKRLASVGAANTNNDASVLALSVGERALVLNRLRPEKSFPIEGLHDVRNCPVSPDGRWTVMCSWNPDQKNSSARIWDAQTGNHMHDLPVYGLAQAWFSPDGHWLVTLTSDLGGRVWEVGSWREVWSYSQNSPPAFSPDGTIMALGGETGVIRLVETATGKELGRLTGPTAEVYMPAAFTRDGARLIANTRDVKDICVWDLRRLRSGLRQVGLDWDWPEIPPAPDVAPLHSAEVDFGYLHAHGRLLTGPEGVAHGNKLFSKNPLNPDAFWFRGVGNQLLKKHAEAVADLSVFLAMAPAKDSRRAEALLRRAILRAALRQPENALGDALQMIQAGPEHIPETEWAAKECNNIAWPYVFPGKKKSDVDRAVVVARAAVMLEPWDADHRNTLGMVLYRSGQWREAIEMLEKNLKRDHIYAGYDFYFLAMSCHQNGDLDEAREYFDRAVGWENQHTGLNAGLRAMLKSLRAEAQSTLRLP